MPRRIRFNQVAGADLFEFNEFGFDATYLNIICWGTGYQIACSIKDKASANAAKVLADVWKKHFWCARIDHNGPRIRICSKRNYALLGESRLSSSLSRLAIPLFILNVRVAV